MKRNLLFLAMAVLVLATFSGCAGRPAKEEMVAGAPKWVNRGSGAFSEKERKIFYGVGTVVGVSNPALEKDAADNRARYEIARVLGIYVSALYKDYQAASTSSDGTPAAEQQMVEQALKTTVDETVRGSKIIDHWRNPTNGALWALGRLDLDDYKELINNAKDLKPQVKAVLAGSADRAFSELEKRGPAEETK